MAQERTNRPKSAGASRRFFAPLRARRAETRRTRPTSRRPLPPRSAGRFPSRGARALRVSLRAGPAPRFARFPPPAFSPFLPRPPATRRALLPFLPSLPGGRAARFLPIFIPIPCCTTLRFPQRAAARFSPFLSPSHRDAKNFVLIHSGTKKFFGKNAKRVQLFGRFARLYIGACDRGVWSFRRVRRAGPAAAGENRRNGACARAVWGAAQPRPGGRNCRPRGETDGSGARAVIQGARRTRGKLREGIRPNPPRREKFSSPFHTARNNFLGKYKMDETFWAFRVSIYRGACDRDAWPSRRVRRAAPAAAGGSRRNGPARCLGGRARPHRRKKLPHMR